MKTHDKTIALKLSADLLEKITAIAKAEDRALSSMVRVAILEYIKNHTDTNEGKELLCVHAHKQD